MYFQERLIDAKKPPDTVAVSII